MSRIKLFSIVLIVISLINCAGNKPEIRKGTEKTPAEIVKSNPVGSAVTLTCVAGVIVGAVAQSPWWLFALMGCSMFGTTYYAYLESKEIKERAPPEDLIQPGDFQTPPPE